MKPIFILLLIGLLGFTFSNQEKGKKGLLENDLLGKWTNETTDHPMKETAPGSIRHLTFEIKAGHKFQIIDVFTKDGKKIITYNEPGTWEITKDKITFHYSGKIVSTGNDKRRNKKLLSKNLKTQWTINDKPRSVTSLFKIENNSLLFGDEKNGFKNAPVYKKN